LSYHAENVKGRVKTYVQKRRDREGCTKKRGGRKLLLFNVEVDSYKKSKVFSGGKC